MIRMIKVPADENIDLTEVELPGGYPDMNEAMDFRLIERVSTGRKLPDGSDLVFIVDEEGMLIPLPYNVRASYFYPGSIYGDAYFCAEVWVDDPEEGRMRDFANLPENFGTSDLQNLALTMEPN